MERIVLEVYCTGDVLHWRCIALGRGCIALGISERTLGADWSDDKVAKSMLRPSRRETGPKPFPLHRLLRALSSCRKRLIFKIKGMMDHEESDGDMMWRMVVCELIRRQLALFLMQQIPAQTELIFGATSRVMWTHSRPLIISRTLSLTRPAVC